MAPKLPPKPPAKFAGKKPSSPSRAPSAKRGGKPFGKPDAKPLAAETKPKGPVKPKSNVSAAADGDRIAKYLARAGIASRRDAEKLILEGRVKVNGVVLDSPAFKVTSKDIVLFDNKPVAHREPPRVWRYHKPEGLVTSHKDEEDRQTVFQNLPKDLPRVISVGRLDITSEGLLLLTNDGSISRALELPKTGFIRRYRARAYGSVNQDILDTLKSGIDIDGIPTGPIEATLDKVQGGNVWITVTIKEGKNREVRRALDEVGLTVNRLIRTSYGPFQLGKLAKGQVEEVSNESLREMIGHLVDIPKAAPKEEKPGFKGTAKPKRGTFASAKRFQKPGAAAAERHDGTAKPSGKPQSKGPKRDAKSAPPKGAMPKVSAPKDSMPKGRGKFAKR